MSGYAYLGGKKRDLPVTKPAANQMFSLPMYPSLDETEQDAIVPFLKEIAQKG